MLLACQGFTITVTVCVAAAAAVDATAEVAGEAAEAFAAGLGLLAAASRRLAAEFSVVLAKVTDAMAAVGTCSMVAKPSAI